MSFKKLIHSIFFVLGFFHSTLFATPDLLNSDIVIDDLYIGGLSVAPSDCWSPQQENYFQGTNISQITPFSISENEEIAKELYEISITNINIISVINVYMVNGVWHIQKPSSLSTGYDPVTDQYYISNPQSSTSCGWNLYVKENANGQLIWDFDKTCSNDLQFQVKLKYFKYHCAVESESIAYPNPTTSDISLKLINPIDDTANIVITDQQGNIKLSINNVILEKGTIYNYINISNLPVDIYNVNIIRNSYVKTFKIYKW